jgi:hypothetical protein
MIEGVRTKSLKVISDERGRVMEIHWAGDELFQRFGQVYITTTYPQVLKALPKGGNIVRLLRKRRILCTREVERKQREYRKIGIVE